MCSVPAIRHHLAADSDFIASVFSFASRSHCLSTAGSLPGADTAFDGTASQRHAHAPVVAYFKRSASPCFRRET